MRYLSEAHGVDIRDEEKAEIFPKLDNWAQDFIKTGKQKIEKGTLNYQFNTYTNSGEK